MIHAAAIWPRLPLGRGVTLLRHDANGVGALYKPAGILSHPNGPGEEARSLLTASYALDGEVFSFPGGRLWLLNRLDSATSGLILVASEASLAAEIRARFKAREVHKVYQALVFGRPGKAPDTWRDRLAVKKKDGVIRAGTGNIPAECRMTLVPMTRRIPGISLLQLEPRTGRSHQLRVQCANRRVPIIGDQTYGDFAKNKDFAKETGLKRLFLHSLSARFTYIWKGAKVMFHAEAPLPAEFSLRQIPG